MGGVDGVGIVCLGVGYIFLIYFIFDLIYKLIIFVDIYFIYDVFFGMEMGYFNVVFKFFLVYD